MHVIRDLEGFLKKIEETVAFYFGKDEAGVVGHEAVKAVIDEHISRIAPEASIETPAASSVDNENVEEVAAIDTSYIEH